VRVLRLLSFLLMISLAVPASGQPTTVVHVPDNETLTATSTADYPYGVWRDDYASGNGAPPLFYKAGGNACSLNAGNGDNGSQVKSADGKCWLAQFPDSRYNIRQFGAVGNGSTDDSTAISNAEAALEAVGAGILYLPKGHYCVKTAGLSIN